MRKAAAALIAVGIMAATPAISQENYESWRLHTPTFGSTGGGGVIISEYNPVIADGKCTTDFTTTFPDGKAYFGTAEFDAVPEQGGILCTNGRWRSRQDSGTGTTPFRVFVKNGVMRASP
jgi:hypothetical protein